MPNCLFQLLVLRDFILNPGINGVTINCRSPIDSRVGGVNNYGERRPTTAKCGFARPTELSFPVRKSSVEMTVGHLDRVERVSCMLQSQEDHRLESYSFQPTI